MWLSLGWLRFDPWGWRDFPPFLPLGGFGGCLQAASASDEEMKAGDVSPGRASVAAHPPDLPEELVLYILAFTGTVGLAKASRLSRRFRTLLLSPAADGSLWRRVFAAEFGSPSHRELAGLCAGGAGGLSGTAGCWRRLALQRARPRANFRRADAIIRRLNGHRSWVTSGCLGRGFAVTAGRDARILVWSTGGPDGSSLAGPPSATLSGHQGGIRVIRANERVVVSGGADRALRVGNLRTGASAELGSHDAGVGCLDVDLSRPDRQHGLVASGAGDNVVRLWDLGSCRPVGRKSGASGAINSVRLWGPASVACGSSDKVVRIFDLREPDDSPPALSLFGHLRKVFQLELLEADPHLLLSESHSGQEVLVWDTRRPVGPVHCMQWDRPITGFGLSSARPLGESSSAHLHQATDRLVGWDELRRARRGMPPAAAAGAAPAEVLRLGDPADAPPPGAAGLRGDADDWGLGPPVAAAEDHRRRQLFAVGLADGSIEVWDPVEGRQTHEHRSPLAGTRSRVTCCTLQADGRLVAAHADGRIAGWDTRTGASSWVYRQPQLQLQPQQQQQFSEGCGTPLSLSMDDSRLLVSTSSGLALLFDFDSPLLREGAAKIADAGLPEEAGGQAWWRKPFSGSAAEAASFGGCGGGSPCVRVMRAGLAVNYSG